MSFVPECKLVPIAKVNTDGRLRQADVDQVEAIRSSIMDVGLINPITVCCSNDGYVLVAGLHRMLAYEMMGWFEIQAVILDLSDLEMQIAECDENLHGPVLTPTEKALFTARRKEAFEAIHGPAKANSASAANAAMGRGDVTANLAVTSFATDTAAKTGQSERAVQRDAERGEKVIDEVLNLIRGTHLDTGVVLDKLKGMSPNDQLQFAKRELAAGKAARAPREAPTGSEPAGDATEFDPMAVRPFVPPTKKPEPLPTSEEMRDAILTLCKLEPSDFLRLSDPRKRPALLQRLVHLIGIFERVREEIGA